MDHCWSYQCWNGWGPCAPPVRVVDEAGGNLFAGVNIGNRWYLTRYRAMGWEASWFETPLESTISPDFVGPDYIELTDLSIDGQSYHCVGVAGSQYGDASRVPGLHGDSCVWYQLCYQSSTDPESPPVAALARVAVRSDGISTQRADLYNHKFELTHCWLLKDENGDLFRFDEAEKLCGYHDVDRKTCVGPGHFAYQELRQEGGDVYRVRYWTPGTTEAVVDEWDNPSDVLSTSWKVLFFDAHCFPVCLATRSPGVTDTSPIQKGHRDLIAGFGTLGGGSAITEERWVWEFQEAFDGIQHIRVSSVVNGTGSGWPTLTEEQLRYEVTDWAFVGGAGDFAEYYPDDDDEEFPLYAFPDRQVFDDPPGRYNCSWIGYTYQWCDVVDSNFTVGYQVTSSGGDLPQLSVRGVAYNNGHVAYAHIAGAETESGDPACRAYPVPTNSCCAASSHAPAHSNSEGGNPEFAHLSCDSSMYDIDPSRVLYDDEGTRKTGSIAAEPATMHATPHVMATPLFEQYQWKQHTDDSWYFQNVPPTLCGLVRRGAPVTMPDHEEEDPWPSWMINVGFDKTESPAHPIPTYARALWVLDGGDLCHVSIRGKYWPASGGGEPAPTGAESFCYAGTQMMDGRV